MKKVFVVLLCFGVLLFAFCACTPTDENNDSKQQSSSEPKIKYEIPENNNSDIIIDFISED